MAKTTLTVTHVPAALFPLTVLNHEIFFLLVFYSIKWILGISELSYLSSEDCRLFSVHSQNVGGAHYP